MLRSAKRTAARVLGALGLVAVLASAAWAKDSGTGPLDEVDLEARTVTIRDRVYWVGPAAELRDSEGRALRLRDLEKVSGGWVTYSASHGALHPVIQRLTLEDMDSDG